MGKEILECVSGCHGIRMQRRVPERPDRDHDAGNALLSTLDWFPAHSRRGKSKLANPEGARVTTLSVASAPLGRLPSTGPAFREP